MRLFKKMFVAAAALLSVHGLLPMTGTTSAFAAEQPVQKVSAVSYVPNNALFVAYADGSVYEKLPALKAFFKEIISISGDQEQIQRFEKACDVTFHMTGSCYMETPASFDVFSGRDGVQNMAFRGFLNFDDPQEADAYLKDNRESWNYYKSYIEKEDVQMPVSKMDVKDEKYEGKDAFVVSMEFDWGDKPLVQNARLIRQTPTLMTIELVFNKTLGKCFFDGKVQNGAFAAVRTKNVLAGIAFSPAAVLAHPEVKKELANQEQKSVEGEENHHVKEIRQLESLRFARVELVVIGENSINLEIHADFDNAEVADQIYQRIKPGFDQMLQEPMVAMWFMNPTLTKENNGKQLAQKGVLNFQAMLSMALQQIRNAKTNQQIEGPDEIFEEEVGDNADTKTEVKVIEGK